LNVLLVLHIFDNRVVIVLIKVSDTSIELLFDNLFNKLDFRSFIIIFISNFKHFLIDKEHIGFILNVFESKTYTLTEILEQFQRFEIKVGIVIELHLLILSSFQKPLKQVVESVK